MSSLINWSITFGWCRRWTSENSYGNWRKVLVVFKYREGSTNIRDVRAIAVKSWFAVEPHSGHSRRYRPPQPHTISGQSSKPVDSATPAEHRQVALPSSPGLACRRLARRLFDDRGYRIRLRHIDCMTSRNLDNGRSCTVGHEALCLRQQTYSRH